MGSAPVEDIRRGRFLKHLVHDVVPRVSYAIRMHQPSRISRNERPFGDGTVNQRAIYDFKYCEVMSVRRRIPFVGIPQ